MNIKNLVRENIKNLAPYSSARDEYTGKEGVFLDANENPYGVYNRYPDPYQKELKQKISEIKKVSSQHIFLGNGSDEVIDILFRVFCNPKQDKVLTFTPTYGMYKVSSEINEVELIELPLNDEFQIDLKTIEPYFTNTLFKIIFICSPNNPTGNLIKVESIEYILKNFGGIVVIDEAYIDFSNQESFIHKINEFPNLVVMQTFSKAFGLANLRIGIAFANEEVLTYMNKVKPPYNISGINQETVLKRLDHFESIKNEISEILNQRNFLIEELQKLEKVKKIYPSDANFILVEMEDGNYTYNYLVKNKVIIRNRSKIIPNCVRITIGSKEENLELLENLKRL